MTADGGALAAAARTASRPQRLVGLDMFRGLTMVVMLIVDYNGDAYMNINHAPWNGIHLADYVMPFFLFISGFSMSISLRVRGGANKLDVFRQTAKRAVKLFVVGVLVQGAWFHADDDPSLSLDLSNVRIMGILQRIALSFLIVAAVELFVPTMALPSRERNATLLGVEHAQATQSRGLGLWIFRDTMWKWLVCIFFLVVQIMLTYGVKPPSSWPGCAPTELFLCSADKVCEAPDDEGQLFDMGCSGVGWLDSKILGTGHVHIRGSVDKNGPVSFGFDPEGFITSFGAIFTMYFGLHVGRVWKTLKEPQPVLGHWMALAVPTILAACVLTAWVPFNKRLWSPSYNLFMCGVATVVYAAFYLICDADGLYASTPSPLRTASNLAKGVLTPLQWLGSNCFLFFVLSDCCGVGAWFLSSVTWGEPHSQKNIVAWFQNTFLVDWCGLGASCSGYARCGPARLAYTFVQLLFWIVACGFLHRRQIFWKL